MINKTYYVYYETHEGQFRILSNDGEFQTLDYKAVSQCKRKFYLMKGYSANDSGLRKYMKDFTQWKNELKTNGILEFETAFTEKWAVIWAFQNISNLKADSHEQISQIEYRWMKQACNAGMMYMNPRYRQKKIKCWTNDFSGFYPKILASKFFMIPTKQGKECKLKEVPKMKGNEFLYGFFRVKITCDNDNFRKIFAFSKYNVYTHTSLYQAIKYKDKYKVNIDLFDDDKPNAYIYDKKCMVTGEKLFGKWYKTLSQLKQQYPKNKLVKALMSQLHGYLSERNMRKVGYDEFKDMDVGFDPLGNTEYLLLDYHEFNDESKSRTYYLIQNMKQPQFSNFRLLPFLTSYARNKLSRQIDETNIKDVVRIHTDSVTFQKEHVFDAEDFIPESKSSGTLFFENVNTYINLTNLKNEYQILYDNLCETNNLLIRKL